jgi:hypothetical protein
VKSPTRSAAELANRPQRAGGWKPLPVDKNTEAAAATRPQLLDELVGDVEKTERHLMHLQALVVERHRGPTVAHATRERPPHRVRVRVGTRTRAKITIHHALQRARCLLSSGEG